MTDVEEVVDNYLLWEGCKEEGVKKRVIEGSSIGEELKEEVEEIRNRCQQEEYNLDEKLDQVNSSHMLKMFEYCSWEKETVNIEDLGTTLPHALDLPPEVISGSLTEVLSFVREEDPEEYRGIKYINILKEVPEVLDQFLTVVISPGEILRRQDRMKKQHGEKDWKIEETWGAVHDANHRTVAKILTHDLDEVECFVGRPVTDEVYDHVKL